VSTEAPEEDSEESRSDSGFGLRAGWGARHGRWGVVTPLGSVPPTLLATSVVVPTGGLISLCRHRLRVTTDPMG
jgi:hypothetical protein